MMASRMKALWFAWMVLLLAGCSPDSRKLLWRDEFSQPTLDRSLWTTEMHFAGTTEPRFHNPWYQSYTMDDNVILTQGLLHLLTERRFVPGVRQFNYTQGLVISKRCFHYGYIETRAAFPEGRGMWPCLWLMPEGKAWPPEIDIAEYIGGKHLMHHGMTHGDAIDNQWDSTYDGKTDFTQWHTLGLDWQPGRLVWLVDNIPVKEITASYVPDIPMILILSNSVGADFSQTGAPDQDTVFPNSLRIDWVRVWDRH